MDKSTCKWPECEHIKLFCRGLCQKHYMRAYRLDTFDQPWVAWEAKNAPSVEEPCRWPGCSAMAQDRGLCPRDYTRAYRRQNFINPWAEWKEPGRGCVWPECDRQAESRDLCDRHYVRARSVGTFAEPWLAWRERVESRSAAVFCKWPECGKVAHARMFCVLHYQRGSVLGDFVSPWEMWSARKDCLWCGESFRRARIDAIYCGPKCSGDAFQRNNPDAVKASQKAYARRHPDKMRMQSNARRVRILEGVVEKFTAADVRNAKGDDCYLCGGLIDFSLRHPDPWSSSLDHIVPVSKGGHHTLKNASMTHLRCNLRKGASLVADHLATN